jgi:preprotein translocase subunit SecD
VRQAVETGFNKATWTVLDANITTLITALILFEFGTGPIKGFAVTLSIGIVTSVFAALVITRLLFQIYPGRRRVDALSI